MLAVPSRVSVSCKPTTRSSRTATCLLRRRLARAAPWLSRNRYWSRLIRACAATSPACDLDRLWRGRGDTETKTEWAAGRRHCRTPRLALPRLLNALRKCAGEWRPLDKLRSPISSAVLHRIKTERELEQCWSYQDRNRLLRSDGLYFDKRANVISFKISSQRNCLKLCTLQKCLHT